MIQVAKYKQKLNTILLDLKICLNDLGKSLKFFYLDVIFSGKLLEAYSDLFLLSFCLSSTSVVTPAETLFPLMSVFHLV